MLVAVKLANGEEPKEARLPKSLSRFAGIPPLASFDLT
jgi:hypothetical protein